MVCNYKGTLINGTEFDASDKHGGPATFPVKGVIAGWTEALQLMPVGSRWQFFVPSNLAYGPQDRQTSGRTRRLSSKWSWFGSEGRGSGSGGTNGADVTERD